MYTAKSVIAKLLEKSDGGLAGSIYLPTHPESTSPNMAADRTRFRNAMQQIRQHDKFDARVLSDTIEKLDSIYEDIEFWKHRDLGLAILFTADTVEHFKLPFEMTEAVYLSDHFVVSPLLIMRAVDTSFYMLDVNFTNPRLFYGTHGTLKEVNKDNMPGSLDDEVGKGEYQKQLQTRQGLTMGFHGHTESDAVTDEERRYLKLVAGAVDAHLGDKNIPLLLAGTSNRVGNLRKELTHEPTISESHTGSVEKMNANQLYEIAAPLVQNHANSRRDAAVERIREAAPQYVAIGKDEIIEITKSERSGRVDSLYLPIYRLSRDTVRPGDNTSIIIELPGDIEAIESLVTAVARNGGEVVPVEIEAYDFLDQPKALCRY